MNALKPLTVILVLLAGLLYLGGLVWAGVASLGSETTPTIPEAVTYVITIVGGVLATNFGAIYGISVLPDGTGRARELKITRIPKLTADAIQVVAAWVYVLSLLAAVVFWTLDGFSPESAEVLRNMTFTCIGVLGGVLAVALNVKT
jgi:hypothetical protein